MKKAYEYLGDYLVEKQIYIKPTFLEVGDREMGTYFTKWPYQVKFGLFFDDLKPSTKLGDQPVFDSNKFYYDRTKSGFKKYKTKKDNKTETIKDFIDSQDIEKWGVIALHVERPERYISELPKKEVHALIIKSKQATKEIKENYDLLYTDENNYSAWILKTMNK